MQVLFLLLALVVEIDGISLSYIQDVVLKPIGTQYVNKTTTINGTCDECKCKIFGGNSSANNVALNCFPNNTCQLFPTVPPSYKLQSSITARLYFGANMPPSTSQCCMPNITELISRLQNTTPTVVSFSYALGAIGYDEARPDRAVAIGSGTGDLYWFNPWNMSFIQSQTINGRITIALYNGSMFTGIDNTPRVNVFNDQSLACVNNKTYPSFNRVRKFLFMNNSQTAMVTTQDNKSVTVLDMTSPTQFTIRVSRMDTLFEMDEILSLSLRRANSLFHLEILTARRRSTTHFSTYRRGLEAVLDPTATQTPPGTTSFSSATPIPMVDPTSPLMSVVECGF